MSYHQFESSDPSLRLSGFLEFFSYRSSLVIGSKLTIIAFRRLHGFPCDSLSPEITFKLISDPLLSFDSSLEFLPIIVPRLSASLTSYMVLCPIAV